MQQGRNCVVELLKSLRDDCWLFSMLRPLRPLRLLSSAATCQGQTDLVFTSVCPRVTEWTVVVTTTSVSNGRRVDGASLIWTVTTGCQKLLSW